MEFRLLSILGLVFSSTVAAHLSPDTEAPLLAHMLEVNKEWRHHANTLFGEDRMVHFANDAERIAMHLQLVQRALSSDHSQALQATQAGSRARLLRELHAYALRGVFPRNEVLPSREPVFIDPYGTACAVGHLIITSGDAGLAQRIDAELETAYIRDMHCTGVDHWASVHGFTEDELAWIQPSYESDVVWTGLPGAPSGEVRALLKLENGDLIVAGSFTSASGSAMTNVARYDGTMFHPMGMGIAGIVNCGIVHEGTIILGGGFLGGDIATWNGAQWLFRSAGNMGPTVHALHIHDGVLYAATEGGDFNRIYFVSALVNGQWSWDFSVFNGPIHALTSYGGDLVVGGAFTLGALRTMEHVARFDGETWSQLGNGLDTTVYAFQAIDDVLYAGGVLYADGSPAFGLARFVDDEWTPVPDLHDQLTPWVVGSTEVRTLAAYDDALVFGGTFAVDHGGEVIGSCIGRLASDEAVEPYGRFNNAVRTLTVDGLNLLAGGRFSQVNGAAAHTVVSTDLNHVGLDDPDHRIARVYPNPVTDRLFLDVPEALVLRSFSVVDGQGRIVQHAPSVPGDRQVLGLSGLASGMYSIVLRGADGSTTCLRFAKD